MGDAANLHASCVLIGEAGVLIRGPVGAGKSTLARDLVTEARRAGIFAALVGDDRVRVKAVGGRLVAAVVPAIAGRIEVRGLGIVRAEHETAAVIRLVVDCLDVPPQRMPEPDAQTAVVLGVVLPRIAHRIENGLAGLVLARLSDPGSFDAKS